MQRNVEIKARVSDLEEVRRVARRLSDRPGEEIRQEDVFFRCSAGRLKLRKLAEDRGELIFYDRPDSAGPVESRYVVSGTTDPGTLEMALSEACGVKGVLRKRRSLYRVGDTRIHLDEVEGLGSFVELEVMIGEDGDVEAGEETARRLMGELSVAAEDLVETAYIDLLDPRPAGDDAGRETGDEHFRKLERMYATAPNNAYYRPLLQVRDGEAELRIPVRREFHHAADAVHGSVYFKALDDAAFFAVNSLLRDVFALTASFHLHLLRPVSRGELRARGKVVHRAGKLFLAESELVDDRGEVLARGSGSFVRSRIRLSPEIGYR